MRKCFSNMSLPSSDLLHITRIRDHEPLKTAVFLMRLLFLPSLPLFLTSAHTPVMTVAGTFECHRLLYLSLLYGKQLENLKDDLI